MTDIYSKHTPIGSVPHAKGLDSDMEKACCKDTNIGMSPSSESAKKLVAFASNRLQKEIFGWD